MIAGVQIFYWCRIDLCALVEAAIDYGVSPRSIRFGRPAGPDRLTPTVGAGSRNFRPGYTSALTSTTQGLFGDEALYAIEGTARGGTVVRELATGEIITGWDVKASAWAALPEWDTGAWLHARGLVYCDSSPGEPEPVMPPGWQRDELRPADALDPLAWAAARASIDAALVAGIPDTQLDQTRNTLGIGAGLAGRLAEVEA